MDFSAIESWSSIEAGHLFYAYRKAKSDCFYDRTPDSAERFVRYEEDLARNLSSLFERLRAGQVLNVLGVSHDSVRVVAKKLSVESRTTQLEQEDKESLVEPTPGHAFFSDADRAFARMLRHSKVVPEFRLIGDFNVDIHVLSALWIATVGDKLDKALRPSAYGARLRRTRPEPGARDGEVGNFHTEALGSFQPYFMPYKRWREGGLAAIRSELKAERQVVAMSLDLANYYHQIDPAFLGDPKFFSSLGVELTPWESQFNADFVQFLLNWSSVAAGRLMELGATIMSGKAGIPIGIAATRVISNALLAELDADIETGVAPVYYGRYVDDIFLVLRDPGHLLDAGDVLRYIANRTTSFPRDFGAGAIQLQLRGGYQGESILALQQSKQKAFFLTGRAGLDLLDSIEAQIRSVSSERRLMPSPDKLSSMASAKVLSAAASGGEEADTLRRADGLSVRRLSWALQLRAVEILARDLKHQDWKKEREEFYRFSRSHILRADKILDHFDYLARLLSLAVAMTDWSEAKQLYDAAVFALKELQGKTHGEARVNGIDSASLPGLWTGIFETLADFARDAILSSIRWNTVTCTPHVLPPVAIKLCRELGLSGDSEIEARALAYREADLAKTPYKQHIRIAAARHRPAIDGEGMVTAEYAHLSDLLDFLNKCEETPNSIAAARVNERLRGMANGVASLLPYVFPTRPYSTQEISLFLPEHCVLGDEQESARNWARFTRAVRGSWVWGVTSASSRVRSAGFAGNKDRDVAYLGDGETDKPIHLGISSLLTEDSTWSLGAAGKPDVSRERYARIECIVNQAIQAKPRPTYLLLPELSLPDRWIDTVAGMLSNAGIGLIAGLDYQISKEGSIHSSAVLVLSDTRLGYPASVEIRQVKSLPAPGEDKNLQKDFGLNWTELPLNKPVYVHRGLAFGVLVCSELQNVSHRLQFQGDVDCLMVLSWNPDIETFSALVESASLDVHASIALVNNRRYGDSRVRVPAKKAHLRDVCRLRGGKNEHLVVVELQVDDLRSFQSRANRWPEESDPFKPVPESFEIAPYRWRVPK
ncbi:hypothetical protein LF41_2266 [Lysobacter dokdonensis DS-58]|uniref:RNA-directed DNA polymerase n=1 Tax=Lysobacter dokdonensis DS-58 TaxID=1300345 RepID=A0A0A2X3G7_9GAMM|nr:RNA-directed DNA polymerase [Lysobacter dokdonensis]KGQ19764.1 hypothetical protein LF41_2266 [Lysobacter dokdonensis DS-58]